MLAVKLIVAVFILILTSKQEGLDYADGSNFGVLEEK